MPWPPLFDGLLAACGWVLGGGHATDASVALASTIVPVVLGVALIALLARLSSITLGPATAVVAAACAAGFGWHVDLGLVGRPDQHVAELVLLAVLLLLVVGAVGSADAPARRRRAVAAGVVLAAAFWNWLGSGLYVVLLGALWSSWHVAAPRGDRRLAEAHEVLLVTGAAASALLLVTVRALGPEGALGRGEVTGMSALPAALCLALAGVGAGLRHCARRRPEASRGVRALEVAVVGSLSLLVLASPPALRAGLAQGLTALRTSNPWYAHIREFQPIVGSGLSPIAAEARTALAQLGLLPLAALLGVAAVPSLVRQRPELRFGAFVVVAGFAMFLPLAVLRARFGPYLGVFAPALAAAAAGAAAARPAAARWRWAVGAAVVAVAIGPCVAHAISARRLVPGAEAALALARVAGERSRAAVPPGDGTVLGSWGVGHHLRYGSGLPVLMTPFGSEGGAGALEDGLGWFVARRESEAAELERRRRVRWIVLPDPLPEVALGVAVLRTDPAPARLVRDVREGAGIELAPGIDEVVSVRLFYSDGTRTRAAGALSRYRLVDEVADGPRVLAKLFEVVPGARLTVTGAAPNAPVVVEVTGVVNGLRAFRYDSAAAADPRGEAELVLPYASGRSGGLEVRAVRVTSASASALVDVPEAAVARGESVRVPLGVAQHPR